MSNEPKFYAGHDYPTRLGETARIKRVREDGCIEGYVGTALCCWYLDGSMHGPHGTEHPYDLLPVKLGNLFDVGKSYRTRDGKDEVRIERVMTDGRIVGIYALNTSDPDPCPNPTRGIWYPSGRTLLEREHPNDLMPGVVHDPALDFKARITKLEARLAKAEEENAREFEQINARMETGRRGLIYRLDKTDERLTKVDEIHSSARRVLHVRIDRIGERLEAMDERFSPAPPEEPILSVLNEVFTGVTVTGGDYTYSGHIVATFAKRKSGEVRYVVEDENGRLFIHNAKQVGL